MSSVATFASNFEMGGDLLITRLSNTLNATATSVGAMRILRALKTRVRKEV